MSEIQTKEFGDWAVVFWKKGSKTLHIAQNQGDPGTTDFWMVGTTTRQFDYESGWLPNKEWSSTIKGHFSKDKAIQMAKERAEKSLKESRINIPNKFPLSLEDLKEAYPGFEEISDLEVCATEAGEAVAFATVERTPKGYILMGPPGCDYVYEGSSIGELGEDMEDLIHNLDVDETWPSITNNNLNDFDENVKENEVKKLKENTFESYWSNGGTEALKNRFHEICSELGVWTREDKGCENFGLYLRIGHSYSDENDLRLHIVSPKYYLSDNSADLWARPNNTEDFDEWVTKYIKEYSWLFKEKDSDAYKHLVKSENPEPWNTFVASEGSFRKALRQTFKSDVCKYIDMDEQYDMYGEEHFEVDSTSDDAELSITFNWCGDKNPDDYTLFKFDGDLNYTATMNGETVTGQGYEDAAKQYVLRIANKYAEGEFAKEYEPECYELRVYLRQDFYAKASKNIWQGIESILEDNCGTYTNYQPEDWADDRAAVWTSVEVEDLKHVLNWLKKRRSAPRIEIWDENRNNVTSQFWTPKVEESTKISEDGNCVVVKILDSFDTEARNVIESYGGQLDYDIWSISKENIQDVKDEIDDWKNRIAFYSSYNYSSGRFGKKLTESKVILHFDLEDGEHKAIPFESTQAAMEYMDSDDFPVGEWVGDYELEYVKEKPAEDEDYEFKVLEPEDIEKLNELVKEIKDHNEDGWVEWTEFVVDVARKYLGESLSRYGEGEYTPFEDLINECEPFVYYRTTVVDKLLNKRLAFQKELEQMKESTNLKEKRIESGELNGVEDYLYVIRSAGLQYIEGEKTSKGATPVVIKLTNGEARLRIFEPGNYTLFTDFMGWEGLNAEEFADDLKDLLSFRG